MAEQRNRFLLNLRIVQQAQNLVERIVLLDFLDRKWVNRT